MTTRTIMPYVKLHVHKLTDTRFLRLTPALLGRWTQLLLLAKHCEAGGALIQNGEPMKPEDLALLLRCSKEDIVADLRSLRQACLIHANGRGWQLNDYEDEQGPDDEGKRYYWRERQRANREKKKNLVMDSTGLVADNPGHVKDSAPAKSKSNQIKEESNQIKEESNQIKPLQIPALLEILAIPQKFRQQITDRNGLTWDIILAAYTSAVAEKEKNPKVKSPAGLAGWKLAQGEDPDPIWKDISKWQERLPAQLLKKLGFSIREEEQEEIPVSNSGYTQLPACQDMVNGHTLAWCWDMAKQSLQTDMKGDTFDRFVRDTYAYLWDASTSTLWVLAANLVAADWLTNRLASTAVRLMVGICNQEIEIKFVVPPSTKEL